MFKLNVKNEHTVLHTFAGKPDGWLPYGGVILDSAGNIYGATYEGGASNLGMVYKIDTAGKETALYSFTGTPDGALPGAGSLVMDQDGNLYGTTISGGRGECNVNGVTGCGTVFELAKDGTETVLYRSTGGKDGSTPVAGLIFDTEGNLYSTTADGGEYGYGTVFKLTPQ